MDMHFEGAIAPAVKPHKHTSDCGCEPAPSRKRARRTLEARLWSKVDKSGGPQACWPWTGSPDVGSGYGRIMDDGIKTQAHRAAYKVTHGSIPAGKNVLHARGCSKLCCNPAHLRAGDQLENMADAKAEKKLRRNLKPAEVCAIVESVRDKKLDYRKAAAKHGVSPQTVFNIMTGKTWSKLTGIGKVRKGLNSRGKRELRRAA